MQPYVANPSLLHLAARHHDSFRQLTRKKWRPQPHKQFEHFTLGASVRGLLPDTVISVINLQADAGERPPRFCYPSPAMTRAQMKPAESAASEVPPWEECRRAVADEYGADHAMPWIVGFSGGKDSTVVAHLVFEHLLSLPRSERKRTVHIVANDTLVESPLVIGHIKAVLDEMRRAASAFGLPVVIATTAPDVDQTFWVNLIGRGYPSPNRSFRWCTDRMKIQPTSQYIKQEANSSGSVILLLGVRRTESAARAASASRYDNGERLNRHNDLLNCLVFRPILELTTEDVWEFLGSEAPPWGGTHSRLIKLYRDAGGGECPVVTAKADAPSCGTSSSRFGCWTCTVVDKDRSLSGFVEAGFEEFTPLLDFRDWLVSIRNDPERRLARRRDGRFTITQTGVHIPGPFTRATRSEILVRLLALQNKVGHELISRSEVERIRSLWADDALSEVNRATTSQ